MELGVWFTKKAIKSLGCSKNLGEYLEAFFGGIHKSKVAQNPKICRKPLGFLLWDSMSYKSAFLIFMIFGYTKSQFSKANLVYLNSFFGGYAGIKIGSN